MVFMNAYNRPIHEGSLDYVCNSVGFTNWLLLVISVSHYCQRASRAYPREAFHESLDCLPPLLFASSNLLFWLPPTFPTQTASTKNLPGKFVLIYMIRISFSIVEKYPGMIPGDGAIG